MAAHILLVTGLPRTLLQAWDRAPVPALEGHGAEKQIQQALHMADTYSHYGSFADVGGSSGSGSGISSGGGGGSGAAAVGDTVRALFADAAFIPLDRDAGYDAASFSTSPLPSLTSP